MHHINGILLQENHRVALGFPPDKGYIFLRVLLREPFTYLYDRILSEASLSTAGQISSNEFLTAFVLENTSGDNVIEVQDKLHLYQIFYGISPPNLRTYVYVPTQTARRAPDVETIVTRAKWGYIDGWESPFNHPSPRTETFLPPGENLIAYAIWNPDTREVIDPLLWFVGQRCRVEVIRNVQFVQQMLAGQLPVRFATVGGIKEEVQYSPRQIWGVDPVKPTMSATEIGMALR